MRVKVLEDVCHFVCQRSRSSRRRRAFALLLVLYPPLRGGDNWNELGLLFFKLQISLILLDENFVFLVGREIGESPSTPETRLEKVSR